MTRYFDNTRISSFKVCPRKYYFRHVRHWRKAGTAAPLVFGSSWHAAMDVVWQLAKTQMSNGDILVEAMKAFWAKWEDEGMPKKSEWSLEHETKLGARTPNNAAEMLAEYIEKRRPWMQEIELLAVEKPFAVPLDPKDTSAIYVGRRDKDFRYKGFIYCGEHKTTTSYSIEHGLRSNFIESFSPNSQVDGYIHAGHMDYGNDFQGVWIDAALVHKKVRHFKFIPVSRMLEMLDAWLFETRKWIALIFGETANLELERLERPTHNPGFMRAFPKNTESCDGKYEPCTYINLCKAWKSPDEHAEPPEGFIVEKWEPFKELELSKIGLKDEDK